MQPLTKAQLQTLGDTLNEELTAFRSVLKALGLEDKRQLSVRWSNGLKKSAGRFKGTEYPNDVFYFRVTISGPIFCQAVRDNGLEKACEALRETAKHEFGHVLTPHEPGHGYRWAEAVRLLGGTPTRYHSLTAGTDLIEGASEIKQRYPIGAEVVYVVKGVTYQGQILRHNSKRVSISREEEGWWKIPYGMMDEVIQEVVG